MTNVVVIGSQWGDEGKGKIVDWLSERADVVVRFQGGHNAGHTLVIDGKVYKLSLLPSGVVRRGKLSVIGNGVVVDPWALMEEIERVRAQGVEISPSSLMVAENASLILPVHRDLDHAREAARGEAKIGTTGRGIGPAYEDKVARRAIRVCDLADPSTLPDRVNSLLLHHNALLKGMGAPTVDPDALIAELEEIAPKLLPYAGVVWKKLEDLRRKGRRILFEGAQGVMLDVDHGTYPFVTSSNTGSGQAATGSGMGPGGRRICARHHQGLYDAGRFGTVPDGTDRRDRRTAGRTGPGIRRRHRPEAALRLVRRGFGPSGDEGRRRQRDRADQAGRPGWAGKPQCLHRLSDRWARL